MGGAAALVSRARPGRGEGAGRSEGRGTGGGASGGEVVSGAGRPEGRSPTARCTGSALREQALLKARVLDQDTEAWQRDPAFAGLQRVGGVDVSFVKGDSVRACASLVVLSYPELEVTVGLGRRCWPGSPAGLGDGNAVFVGFR